MPTKRKRRKIGCKKVHPNAVLPTKSTAGSSGFDLFSVEDVSIETGARAVVSVGLSFEIPPDYEIQIRPRSGYAAKYGVTVLNSPGTIDADFKGVCKVILQNHGPRFEVKSGDRIAQAVVQKLPPVQFVEVEELSVTDRGEGGFGSTGK